MALNSFGPVQHHLTCTSHMLSPMPPENRALHLVEQRHRLLADYAKDVIWTMGLDGAITYISPAIFQLRGLTPEEAMQQPLDQILTPPSQAASTQYFVDLLTAAQEGQALPDFKGEMEYYRKDGSTFWTEVLAFPITDADGTLMEVLGVTRDISARKLYEDELKAARDSAERANLAKREFLAHISHEVRTPMTSLLAYMEQASQTDDREEQHDLLSKARASGDLLLHLINDILDFSKIESGKLELKPAPFILSEGIQQVSDLVAQSAKTKGLDYGVVFEIDPQTRLHGDAPRLTQALLNLVSNAIKFTDQGFVRVRVEQLPHTEPSVTLKFSVQDSGQGLSADMCERVFERFVQGEHRRDSQTHGTGLGLSICRQLAQLMHGDAGASSVQGQGSTFWFTASLTRPMNDVMNTALNPTATPTSQRTLTGCHVLIVDDDDAIRDAMCRLLKGHGMCVDTASNAMAAIDKLRTQHFDVLLADVRMPDMSGLELTETLRHDMQSSIKIIGISAGALDNDRDACLEAGMDEHISKPFKVKELLTVIENTL